MKKIVFSVLLSVITVALCSCYDSTEVDDMIYVLAIGIDNNDGNTFLYTFQAAVPLNISSGIETGFAASEESVTLQNLKVSAPNLYTAIDIANQKATKEFNISHCKLIIFSQELAENGLKKQLDSITNNPEFRPTVSLAVSVNSAEKYLGSISSPFELNPARYYDMVFEKDFAPQTFAAHLYDFDKHEVVLVPLIDGEKKITTSVIKNYTETGILDVNETIALNMLTGNYKNGFLTVSPEFPAINLSQYNPPKITVNSVNPLSFTINLSFYGTPTASANNFKHLDDAIKKHIKTSCEGLLNKSAKEFKADIAHLGRFVKKKFISNNAFEKYNYEEQYQQAEFKVNVDYRTIRQE